METTIVGRHVKRGADERAADEQREQWYDPDRYIGLHEEGNLASRAKRHAHYRRRARAAS